MLKKIILAITLLTPIVSTAQDTDPKTTAMLAARDMCQALLNQDYYKYVQYTHPTVISMTNGGANQFIANLQRQVASLQGSGSVITKLYPGEPSNIIDTAGELQCTIPQNMVMKIKGGTIETESTIIGVSPDKGSSWYFIDANGKDITMVRYVFPSISSKLVIPAAPAPKFTADKL